MNWVPKASTFKVPTNKDLNQKLENVDPKCLENARRDQIAVPEQVKETRGDYLKYVLKSEPVNVVFNPNMFAFWYREKLRLYNKSAASYKDLLNQNTDLGIDLESEDLVLVNTLKETPRPDPKLIVDMLSLLYERKVAVIGLLARHQAMARRGI